MECLRGFSYMPESKAEVMDLQYIEGGELSRAWKISRRQRLKELEQKIWSEFVKERDIVNNVCQDDPYQFLEQLPADCLKELMETELQRMRKETPAQETSQQSPGEMRQPEPAAPGLEEPRCDMLQIFDDDNYDDGLAVEQEANESSDSPCTVRHASPASPASPESPASPPSGLPRQVSPENDSNMIEASIYWAKVKDLQLKICDELLAVITSLEAQDLMKVEPEEVARLQKQSAEFCARFSRIYLYQLQRQINELNRHSGSTLPFARHTHLRSQLTRVVSLLHNLLQSLQVFHKWFSSKAALQECVQCLLTLTQVCREANAAAPDDCRSEEMMVTCDKLDATSGDTLQKVNHFLACHEANTNTARSKQSANSKKRVKKRSLGMWAKVGNKTNVTAEERLSMYSLDSRGASCRDALSGGTSKLRINSAESAAMAKPEAAEAGPKKKTPRYGS